MRITTAPWTSYGSALHVTVSDILRSSKMPAKILGQTPEGEPVASCPACNGSGLASTDAACSLCAGQGFRPLIGSICSNFGNDCCGRYLVQVVVAQRPHARVMTMRCNDCGQYAGVYFEKK